MSYATAQDMVDRFGEVEIQKLDPDSPAYPRVTATLGDAAAEIDASLAPLYSLPLASGPWPLLRSLACDLARLALYDNSVPEAVMERAKAARETLASVRSGKLSIVDAAGAVLRRTTAASFKGPDPVMTAENLEGLA